MDERFNTDDCVVWKLGGSILRRGKDYDVCAAQLAAAIDENASMRIVVVVSARFGVTNRLLRQAAQIVDDPSSPEVDLLLATGELQSVAQLSMRLRRTGVACSALTPDEIGLRIDADSGRGFSVEPAGVLRKLASHRVVVVPGFLGTRPEGGWGTLGRGGSDLTAVALAAALRARRCELIKDVPGYFTTDPHVEPSAVHLGEVDYSHALKMAAAGCDLVQAHALRHAERDGVELILRSVDNRGPRTIVRAAASVQASVGRDVSGGDSFSGVADSLAAAAADV